MTRSALTRILDRLFPSHFAVEGDTTGVQIDMGPGEVERIGIAYEITDDLLASVKSIGIDYLIAFHPLIYRPLPAIQRSDRVGRCVMELIQQDIPLFVTHTRLDAHPNGTNQMLADRLGLNEVQPLLPLEGQASTGMGRVGNLPDAIPLSEFCRLVQETTAADSVRATSPSSDSEVRRVALVAGSGMSYYAAAVSAGADVFLTGDVRYHDFHASLDQVLLVDPGHAESECFVLEATERILASSPELHQKLKIIPLEIDTRPSHRLGWR